MCLSHIQGLPNETSCLWEDGDEHRAKAVSVQEKCRWRKNYETFFSSLELELNKLAAKHTTRFRNVPNTSEKADRH